MGITQYQRAQKFLKILREQKGEYVTPEDFVFAMRVHIGNDKHKTQLPYFQLMKSTNLIEEMEDGKIKIKVNLEHGLFR